MSENLKCVNEMSFHMIIIHNFITLDSFKHEICHRIFSKDFIQNLKDFIQNVLLMNTELSWKSAFWWFKWSWEGLLGRQSCIILFTFKEISTFAGSFTLCVCISVPAPCLCLTAAPVHSILYLFWMLCSLPGSLWRVQKNVCDCGDGSAEC